MSDPIINQNAARVIPVSRPSLGPLEANAVSDTVRSGWISQGPKVEQFEKLFAASHGRQFGVACCSGTSALQLALATLQATKDLDRDDSVLCPTLTMVAVPNSILYVDCVPEFVDSCRLDGNMDCDPRRGMPLVAIVPHLYGVPAAEAMRHLLARGVTVIEDCAEVHYASTGSGAPVGSRGRMATFSFYANKIITTGEGGMVLTDSERDAEILRSLRSHAFTPGNHFHHQGLAYGMRMTDVQAAIGLEQHCQRSDFLQKRTILANTYRQEISDAKIELPYNHYVDGAVWWVYPILVRNQADRDALRYHLAEHGIETRTYFHPMHLQPHLRRFAYRPYPIAEDLASRGLYLPLYPSMTIEDAKYVAAAVDSFWCKD